MPANSSVRPGRSFWFAGIVLSIACVAFFYLTRIAETAFGILFSDLLGMIGAVVLLYATAQLYRPANGWSG